MLKWINDDQRIYAMGSNGEILAEVTWIFDEDRRAVINHTFVDESLRGQGIAGELMNEAVKFFREKGYQSYGTCSYAKMWYLRHSDEVEDIIVNQH